MRKRLFVIFMTVIVMMLGCIGCSTNSKDVGSTNANIVNGGMIAKDNEWIYYAIEDGLYKCKEDGSDTEKMLDVTARSLNIADGWIYFCSPYEGVYKIKTDGTEHQMLIAEENIWNLHMIGEWLYFYKDSSGSIYKVKTDGSEKTEIYRYKGNNLINSESVCVDKNNIYYSETDFWGTNAVSAVSIEEDNINALVSDYATHMIVEGEWIYYGNGDAIYKIKADGSENQQILESRHGYFNVLDEWIYYYDYDKYGIHKAKVDGTNVEKISDSKAFYLHIVGEWLYYYSDDAWYRIKIDGSQEEIFAQ